MTALQIRYTNSYEAACTLRDAGFEPIECAFGQHGSVLGKYNLDHHGTESHREGVALRACRDLYGARARDPRFVVTGTPDADAILAIIALAGLVPRERIPVEFYELVDEYDTDPIGKDLLASDTGEQLAWFNQRPGLLQNERGFRKGIEHMAHVLLAGLNDEERFLVRRTDEARRRKAVEGVLSIYDRRGLPLDRPDDPFATPARRGAAAIDGRPRVAVVRSVVWGFDVWYRLAPVVVSYAARMAKVTVGCPDLDTATRLFGPEGLDRCWRALGRGWGGRATIGGSPRGVRLSEREAQHTAEVLLELLEA